MENDIVIAGMSGRFPESNNVEEFWTNLINGTDMVTENDRRWPIGFAGLPTRKGTLKIPLDKFDAEFFNIHPKQVERLDPRLRLLLEVTWEAIVDSGTNPNELRGKTIGVYVGVSTQETLEAARANLQLVSRFDATGSTGCMFANRVSFAFDLRGPSVSLDTYCSSSLFALHVATKAILDGECQGAIVAGINLLVNPLSSLQLLKIGVLSMDGKCKAFDARADGYAQSDTVAAVYISKKSLVRRAYATILNTKTNADGFKENGLTFPSGESQKLLMRQTYKEVGLCPEDVFYVEAHGTGTVAGDTEELGAIDSVFCTNRLASSLPLLIGSTKSNMGHSEPAASIAAVIKVLLSFQHGMIPPNLHYFTPNPAISALSEGRLKVVTEPTEIRSNLVSICSAGVGGSNVHLILKGQKVNVLPLSTKVPTLVPFSARTLQGLNNALSKIGETYDLETVRILSQIFEKPINDHKCRGFTVFDQRRQISSVSKSLCDMERRPLWFVFPGMGSQWSGMAKEILKIDTIRNSIEKSAQILKPYGIDVFDLVINQNEEGLAKYVSVAFTVVGIALVDFVKSLNLIPDGYIGHSAGEVLCAYQDGCWSAEEALIWQYHKDVMLEELQGNYGMAAVGLTWDQALTSCPKSIFPACHNAYDNVTVSGPLKNLNQFIEEMKCQGIFAKLISTGGNAFHSPYVAKLSDKLESVFKEVVKNERVRSPKWILTGIDDPLNEESIGQFFNAAYVRHQGVSPVLFHTAVQKIPGNAVVLEIGSHCIFQNILKRTLPSTVTLIPTMKRDESDNLQRLYKALGTLFVHGFHPKFSALLSTSSEEAGIEEKTEKVTSISSLVQAGWDHSQTYPLLDYMPKSGTEMKTKVSLDDPEWEFLKGHKIDGRILFPGSGYLVLVWKAFASLLRKDMNSFCVKFENVVIHQATVLQQNRFVEFSTSIHESSGNFEISESEIVVVSGKIQIFEEDFNQNFKVDGQVKLSTELVLNKSDIYKDFRLRGYNYSGQFQGILHSTINVKNSEVACHSEWISFLDTLIQIPVFAEPVTLAGLYVPTRLKSLTVDPRILNTQNYKSIPVQFCPVTNVLTTIGLQMVDLRLTLAPRRKTVQVEPCFQNWRFEPYFDDTVTSLEFVNGFKICVDIVLENVTKPYVTVEEITEAETNSLVIDVLEDIAKVSYGRLKMSTMESNVPELVIHCLQNFDNISTFLSKAKASFCLFIVNGKIPQENLVFEAWNLLAVKITTEDLFYLFKKKNPTKLHEIVIPVNNTNFQWLKPLQMALSDITPLSRIWLTSTDPDTGLVGFVNCLRKEPGGDVIRCLLSPQSKLTEEMIQADLVMNVYDVSSAKFGSFRSFNLAHDPYSVSAHAYLNVLNTGDLATISWVEASPRRNGFPTNDFLCIVDYAALNFRDIMLATGKLSIDALPGEAGRADCVLGMEFSGVDASGLRIMGVIPLKGMATHVTADPNWIWKIPKKWSMAEAATVPMAYSTAYYALVIRGHLKSHESVLITSGTGGVGQAAIAIALSLNCEVFTTVGSSEKKEWLTTKFPEIKEDHVFSSGTTEFSQKILELTNHRGVDVVLNSLAEEKLQAALLTLGTGGRFLEIGKFDLSQNNSMGMEIFLKNISFHGILIDSLYDHDEKSVAEKKLLVAIVQEGIDTGVVKPLPSTIFDPDRAKDAFRFMASGRHMGKVVLRMRDDGANSEPDLKVISRTYFHPGKVYVVVGGLGGFGLEFITWLVRGGARNVAILSRTGISTGYQKLQISRWEEAGVKLFFENSLKLMNNFATADSLSEFLNRCSETGGPIGGIFNLAMVLKDALVENQTEENFDLVTRPKYFLTLLLDQASRLTCPELDHFVVFSSVASVYGNAGQSPYGFGNSAMERLCARRQREGLPGLAIAWGAIADVGVVHERMNKEAIGGTLPQPLTSCLEILDRILHPKFKDNKSLVSSLILPNDLNTGTIANKSSDLKMTLPQKIARILGLSSEKFESKKDTPLGDLGLDSLMVIEVKNALMEEVTSQNFSSALIKKLTWVTLNEIELNQSNNCCDLAQFP